MVRLTNNPGEDEDPAWSPDGKSIAYITNIAPELFWYATRYLAVVPVEGGTPQILTRKLDRNVSSPRYSPDGPDDSLQPGGQLRAAPGPHPGRWAGTSPPVIDGPRALRSFVLAKDGTPVALLSEPTLPGEIFVAEQGKNAKLRRLTKTNDAFLAPIRLADVEKIRFKSADGTDVEGFLYKPPAFIPELKYPTLLRIHGGPTAQFDYGFDFEPQIFAANGYLVVLVNPRGSTGRRPGLLQGHLRRLGQQGRSRMSWPAWTMPLRKASPIRIGSAWAAGRTAAS